MLTPKCPLCGAELLQYEHPIDTWYDHDLYCERWKGFCETCDIDFKWIKVFAEDDIIDMEKVEKGE